MKVQSEKAEPAAVEAKPVEPIKDDTAEKEKLAAEEKRKADHAEMMAAEEKRKADHAEMVAAEEKKKAAEADAKAKAEAEEKLK
jgi:hypothetical protein